MYRIHIDSVDGITAWEMWSSDRQSLLDFLKTYDHEGSSLSLEVWVEQTHSVVQYASTIYSFLSKIECTNYERSEGHCPNDATHFLEPKDAYDPVCDACFEKEFTTCNSCNRTVQRGELGSRRVMAQTHWSPEEWKEVCIYCAPERPEREDLE